MFRSMRGKSFFVLSYNKKMITWDYYEAIVELLRCLGTEPMPASVAAARPEVKDRSRRIREMIMPALKSHVAKPSTSVSEGAGVRWALVGSVSSAVQDMTIEVHDLDVFIRASDLERAREALSAYSPTQPVEVEKENGHKIREFNCEIQGVRVQCFTAPEDDPYVQKLKEYGTRSVYLSTLKIPCLPIEAQMEAYEMTGKPEKAKAIQNYFEEVDKKKEQERRRK